jgi:hypothetical protein
MITSKSRIIFTAIFSFVFGIQVEKIYLKDTVSIIDIESNETGKTKPHTVTNNECINNTVKPESQNDDVTYKPTRESQNSKLITPESKLTTIDSFKSTYNYIEMYEEKIKEIEDINCLTDACYRLVENNRTLLTIISEMSESEIETLEENDILIPYKGFSRHLTREYLTRLDANLLTHQLSFKELLEALEAETRILARATYLTKLLNMDDFNYLEHLVETVGLDNISAARLEEIYGILGNSKGFETVKSISNGKTKYSYFYMGRKYKEITLVALVLDRKHSKAPSGGR